MNAFFWKGVVLAISIVALAHGYDAQAMQVEPAIFDLQVDPGSTVKSSFLLKNDEKAPQTYYFSLQKFVPQGENGDQRFLSLKDTEGLPSWTFLSRPMITLAPGQETRVPFSIIVPEGTSPRSVQEALFVSTAAPGVTDGVGIGVRTGMLVFVTIGAPVPSTLTLGTVTPPAHAWQTHLPVSFSFTLTNPGVAYQTPKGTIVVRNIFGRERARLPFNPYGARVLAGQERRFEVAWQEHPSAKEEGFWAQVGEELSNGGIGPYRISLELDQPGQHTNTLLTKVSLWPLRLIVLVTVVLISLILFALGLRRRFVSQLIRQHKV